MPNRINRRVVSTLYVVLYDIVTFWIASFVGLLVVGNEEFAEFKIFLLLYTIGLSVFHILVYAALSIYRIKMRYASVHELILIAFANIIVFGANFLVCIITKWLPIKWTFTYTILAGFFTCSLRFGVRILFSNKNQIFLTRQGDKTFKRAMVIGAGSCGISLVREMLSNDALKLLPVCFIDDDETKIGQRILGVKVYGGMNKIREVCALQNVDIIYIAIASISAKRMSEIVNICKETNIRTKVVPGMGQLMNGQVSLGQTRDVNVADLLGREEIKVNLDEILGYIEQKVVLVTGGGGTIGSELCRQIASHNPKLLIILDIYENNAYDIEQELKMNMPNVNQIALIASVRDVGKLKDVFKKYKPNVVFHAAAHKHVPLMETSPNEAIKNNVFGTYNTAKLADKYGVEKFILISTDKAVNPTNIMGASKRLCEMVVQMFSRRSKTDFVAVRFGNVLGSNGSVIPLFKKQIEKGGPVTVTHKDIIRYFMTIPEAVSLVLQAGAYAHGGEIFILDMGEPVKIYDLAYNLIRLSGYTPNVDIKIEFTGLRPGEKLYEEMLMAEEGLQDTANKKIHIGKPIIFDDDKFEEQLAVLYKAAYEETNDMKKLVSEVVTTYKYQE